MGNKIDYRSIDLPDNEQYGDWTYAQRRAYLLSEIEDVGHPSLISQTEVARQFDVSQSQISQDLDALGEFVEDTLGSRRQLRTAAVVNRCIAELLREEKWKEAGKLALDMDEWMVRETTLEEMREELLALIADENESAADAEGVTLELEGGH